MTREEKVKKIVDMTIEIMELEASDDKEKLDNEIDALYIQTKVYRDAYMELKGLDKDESIQG